MEIQLYAKTPEQIYENHEHANSDKIVKTDVNLIGSESQVRK